MVLGRYGHMLEGACRQEAETMTRVFETAEIGRQIGIKKPGAVPKNQTPIRKSLMKSAKRLVEMGDPNRRPLTLQGVRYCGPLPKMLEFQNRLVPLRDIWRRETALAQSRCCVDRNRRPRTTPPSRPAAPHPAARAPRRSPDVTPAWRLASPAATPPNRGAIPPASASQRGSLARSSLAVLQLRSRRFDRCGSAAPAEGGPFFETP